MPRAEFLMLAPGIQEESLAYCRRVLLPEGRVRAPRPDCRLPRHQGRREAPGSQNWLVAKYRQ